MHNHTVGDGLNSTLVSLLVTEWESLRAEASAAIERRVNLITWGTTAYAALASAVALLLTAESAWRYEVVTFWILTVGLPFQAISVATLWVGESKRADRAGAYMAAIEAELDEFLRSRAFATTDSATGQWIRRWRPRPYAGLAWESFLRRRHVALGGMAQTVQIEMPYWVTAGYYVMMIVAPAIAAWFLARSRWNQAHAAPVAVIAIAGLWLLFLFDWVARNPPVIGMPAQDAHPVPPIN